jgi:hypothetical protein
MGKHRLDSGSTEAWGGPNLVHRADADTESPTVEAAAAPSRPVVETSRPGTDRSAATPRTSGTVAGPALT